MTTIGRVSKEFFIALVIAVGLVGWKSRTSGGVHVVSDFLFIAGMILLLMGAAGVVQHSGFFDTARYGFRLFVDLVLGRPRRPEVQDGGGRYERVRRPMKDIRYTVAGGLVCLIASVVAAVAST